MLEKYDPGLITGTIGAVIGIMLASILEKIKIVHRFSKLRKNLKDEVELLKEICFANDGRVFDKLPKLVGETSKMVREDRDVPPWFCVLSRYRESNKMAKLLSEIETELSRLGQTYVLGQILTSHKQQTNQGQTSSPLTQVNQAVAQTDTAEEMTNEEKRVPAVLPKDLFMVVMKLMMENKKSKKRALKAIDEAVASMAVDMIGDVDFFSLAVKLKKVGIAELKSVGPVKEEIKMSACVRNFLNDLQYTYFAYIYREVISKADRLSKRALVSATGS